MAAAEAVSYQQTGQYQNGAMMKPSTGKNVNNHNMPPSKVIHCRAVAEGCKETDLVQVMKLFGNIKALKLMPKISQGLVEFEELESAIACVTYSHLQPILVHGRQMYVNYSKSQEINREFHNNSQGQTPTNVLLVTIINVIHPVNVDTLKKICAQQNTEAQRIVIFHKNGLQALVEFASIEDAQKVQTTLNACDIYPGCCTLKIEYSKIPKLNVHNNTAESYDIEIEKRGNTRPFGNFDHHGHPGQGPGMGNKMPQDMSTLLAGAEGFPAVQSIIAKVMAGGSANNPNHSSAPTGVKSLLSNNMDVDNRTTLLQGGGHQYMDQGQHNYGNNYGGGMGNNMDQYNHPNLFGQSQISQFNQGFSSGGGDGGECCVMMVYGINNESMNCEHLYNLFCLYGNVVKIKILVNKTGSAMVQYADRMSTEICIHNLNNVTVFGQQLQLSFSKHPYIVDSNTMTTVFDGSPSVVGFQDSRNNRFKYVPGKPDLFSRIHSPSKVLHYFNAPPNLTEDRVNQVFESFGAEVPLKHASISKPGGKSSSGLLEFSSVSAAVEALIFVNHITLHKDDESAFDMEEKEKSGAPFTFKLAFSPSESINR